MNPSSRLAERPTTTRSKPPEVGLPSRSPHVVIIGGGFGGLAAARSLAKEPVRITVLDRRNHHLFQPLLYQVATATLNASDIAVPIRSILRNQENASVQMCDVLSVDPDSRKVVLSDGEMSYDFLVVATGASYSYFGHDEWASHAPGLKTIEDALEIRRRVLTAYERAEREPNREIQQEWLTFAIVGGGPTGVELAGALAEISRHVLVHDFRAIDPRHARVLLLEGGPRILPTYTPELSEKARQQLEKLGVDVRVNAKATGVDGGGITVGDHRIAARTVLWAAGVAASPLAKSLRVPLDKAGRVPVTPELTVAGRNEIFVIGDLALVTQDGKPLPGLAPVAMQEGRHAGSNIRMAVRHELLTPFRYRNKGSLAVIGRGAAVAEFEKSAWAGRTAWWAWLLVHIYYLTGFNKRLLVLLQWAWAYISRRHGARLITGRRPDEGPA